MILQLFFILIGFILLIKGADVLVDGASAIAKRYNIPDIVIGLTIVALGTSAPELAVSTIAALKGNGGIVIGNVMGSNIANLCLVLGGSGLIAPIAIQKGTVWREIPFCLATALLLLIIVFPISNSLFLVSRVEGIFLLGCLAVYMWFMFSSAKKSPTGEIEQEKFGPIVSIVMVLGGLAGLTLGGDLVVKNSVKIAQQLKVSQEMIGLTIVALGTSLPELATGIVAVCKGKFDIAIGNVVGSNILNTCLVLGIAAAINPVDSGKSFMPDGLVLTAASLMLFIFMFTGKKHKLDRWEAALFLAGYVGYIGYVICQK